MPPVFRHYEAEELEREYLPAHWPNVVAPQIIDEWIDRSTAFHQRATVVTDITYGASNRQRIDLLRPSTVNSAPILAFIHGGYWRNRKLSKTSYSFCVEPLVRAGTFVAMIEYDLCPEVSMDVLVGQVRQACAWIWRHAGDYGGDPTRLHVSGHSAGGHLAAMMAATDWPLFGNGLPKNMIRSIVPISGLYELEPLRLTTLNADLRLNSDMAARNSPNTLAPPIRMPVTVVVGGGESDEFRRQSRDFADRWRGVVDKMGYFETTGHNHFSVIESMTEENDPLTAILLQHLQL